MSYLSAIELPSGALVVLNNIAHTSKLYEGTTSETRPQPDRCVVAFVGGTVHIYSGEDAVAVYNALKMFCITRKE